MQQRGEATRERVLSVAEEMILENGFGATSISMIRDRAAITKGGFFYHFDGKNGLAVALMERYRETDRTFFRSLLDRALELSEDPLQQMLIFLKLLAEAMGDLPSVHPGCLVAAFTYESQQVNEDVRKINAEVILEWRQLFRDQLEKIDEVYGKSIDVSNEVLADMLTAVIEGGIIVSRALGQKQILVDQIDQHRNYVRLLYGQVR